MIYNWNHREALPQIARDRGITYFEIFTGNGGTEYQSNTGTPEDVANELRDTLNAIESGEFTVQLFPTPKSKTGILTYKYKNVGGAIGNVSPGIAGISKTEHDAILEAKRLQWEIERLKSENESEPDDNAQPWYYNFDNINAVIVKIEQLADRFKPAKTPGIAGVPSDFEKINALFLQYLGADNTAQIYAALLSQLQNNPIATLQKLQNALK